MQLLRARNEAVARGTLRTLHLRWCHCTDDRMVKLLQASGAPPHVLEPIPDSVVTYRVCRAYTRPGPVRATTSRVATSFNYVAPSDLLCVEAGAAAHCGHSSHRLRPRTAFEPQAQPGLHALPPYPCGSGGSPAISGSRKDPWCHL